MGWTSSPHLFPEVPTTSSAEARLRAPLVAGDLAWSGPGPRLEDGGCLAEGRYNDIDFNVDHQLSFDRYNYLLFVFVIYFINNY